METIRLCKECGAVLPAAAPGEVCAECANKAASARSNTLFLTASHLHPAAPAAPSLEGGRDFGSYKLIRALGQGGMGAVYEAEETESGRRVALKVLNHALDSKEARQRFLREGRLAASVNHPNSVYIFGAEEVEGQPVITMELVTGGTLQERVVQKGPMPVAEAVEAILHVVAGLEAAAALGVLHRDVKPSNCFIEADGTVKIGDFGLSKSTTGRAETELTMADSFLGTPAFSSPEQLRGDELTVSSDIYAVGVTLYYLLTAHLPFESDNMVRLLAMVLERPPDAPLQWRPDLPSVLNKVVLRCLAKQPAQRFKSYADLRRALAPFSKVATSPATLSLRIAAGVIDKLAVPLIAVLVSLVLVRRAVSAGLQSLPIFQTFFVSLGIVVVGRILYYAIPEHLWGASPGKLICDLRVVDASRSFPSWKQAFIRAVIFTVAPAIPAAVYAIVIAGNTNPLAHPFTANDGSLLFTALLFVAARRSNGFAGLHDWASGTRVIERSAYEAVRPFVEKTEALVEASAFAERFGPYVVLQTLQDGPAEKWLLALDPQLSRKVWIRQFKTPVHAVEKKRRSLHRTGRLRWLNGRRAEAETWDAYEGFAGEAFLTRIAKPQPWSEVRLWLLDLAQELDAAIKDGSPPAVLDLTRIWITGAGHAKLLDFSAPGLPAPEAWSQPPQIVDDLAARRFLRQVAFSALEGSALEADEALGVRDAVSPLPPHGRAFFDELRDFIDLTDMVNRLRGIAVRPAIVTRQRKLMVILGCAAPVALIIAIAVGGALLFAGAAPISDGNKVEISLSRLQELEDSPDTKTNLAEIAGLETFVAANLDKATNLGPTNGLIVFHRSLNSNLWQLGESIKARRPRPSPEELKQAEATVAAMFSPESLRAKFDAQRSPILFGATFVSVMVLPILSFLSALVIRRGIVLRAARIDIVTRDGACASRWRVVVRSLLTWSPLFIAACLGLNGNAELSCWIFGLIFVAGLVGAIVTPQRSLADRIMGTWLAPS